jgi:hypothetical protein
MTAAYSYMANNFVAISIQTWPALLPKAQTGSFVRRAFQIIDG